MACTSYHALTGRWLTSLGKNAKAGDTPTLSIGHMLCGSEFTTYKLAEPVAHDERYDEPLFDLEEAQIGMPDSKFYSCKELKAIWARLPRSFELGGRVYKMGSFGIYHITK